jgi:hypothetical protein
VGEDGEVLGSWFPSRWVEPFRPAYGLVDIWLEQITAQQRHDAALVRPESLMPEARFWEVVSKPSIIRHRWPGLLPKGW